MVVLASAVLLAAAGAGGQHLLSRPALNRFDPAEMGRAEAAMWRSYYEGRWALLGWQAHRIAAGQHGFSWIDSLRLAWHAARSAAWFRRDTWDPRCPGELERYYRVVQRAAPAPFDHAEAARLELAWWQERRQHAATAEVAATLASLAALVSGMEAKTALPGSLLRAEAMAYRDARAGRMTEADWDEIAARLERGYADIKAAMDERLGPGGRQAAASRS